MSTKILELSAAIMAADATLKQKKKTTKAAPAPEFSGDEQGPPPDFGDPGISWNQPGSKSKKSEEKAELKFADLTGLLEGTIVQETPQVAPVSETRSLFYKASVNEIHGEPSVGKTNILAAAVIAELKCEGKVLILDPEDTPAGFIQKIRSLSQDCPAVLDAIREGKLFYLHNPTPEEIILAQTWAEENKPSLVALDGLAEALASEGLNEDVAGDVLKFFRSKIRPFAEKAGAAVLIADHVTKNGKAGSWARGSGAKLGRYDGVSYEVKLGKAYSPTTPGFVKLVVSKDRKGGVGPKGTHVANLHFEPAENGTETRWEDVGPEAGERQEFRPEKVMEEILAFFRKRPGMAVPTSRLRECINARAQTIIQARDILVREGKLEMKIDGRRETYSLKTGEFDPKENQTHEKNHAHTKQN